MKFLRILLTVPVPAILVGVTIFWVARHGIAPREWAYPALLIAGTLSGDAMIRAVFAWADIRPTDGPRNPWAETPDQEEPAGQPLHGGLVIGMLERAAAAACLLSANPSGLAVIVAIKGLARYGEFTNARQREQFIIGTLASLLWASLFAGAALWVSTAPGPLR